MKLVKFTMFNTFPYRVKNCPLSVDMLQLKNTLNPCFIVTKV